MSGTKSRALMGALLLAVLLLPGLAWADEAPGRVYAVIVANNSSVDDNVRPLAYADDDGARYWELFSAMTEEVHLLATLDADTQKVYKDAARASRPPTRAQVIETLRKVQDQVREDKAKGLKASLYVVFAGHGAVDKAGMGYLSLLDGRFTRRELLREVVEPDVADRTHIIIDACQAYFMVNARGGESSEDDRSGETLDSEFETFFRSRRALVRYPRVGVLLSTAGAAEVHEWSEYRGGIFSHEVRSGLLGAADINGDKLVTYPELEGHLVAANALIEDPRAQIQVFVRAPQQQSDAALIKLTELERATLLSVSQDKPARYHISDSRGVRYADFHFASGGDYHVALLWRAPTFFVRTNDVEARLDRDSISPIVALDTLNFVYRDQTRGPVEESYRANLFGVPYGPSFYAGYHAGRARGVGAASDTSITTPADPKLLQGFGLQLAYATSQSQLTAADLDGLQHSADLALDFWMTEWLAFQVFGQYGTSTGRETLPLGNKGDPFDLHRFAVGVGAKVQWALPFDLRTSLDLRTAHQVLVSEAAGDRFIGDPFSLRIESAVGLSRPIVDGFEVGLRAGASVSVLSFEETPGEASETVDILPFGSVFIGHRW